MRANRGAVTDQAAWGQGLMQFALRGMTVIALLASLLVLNGCATYSAGFQKVEAATAKRDLEGALKSLEELKLTGADELLHFLNKGTLLRLKGDYAGSNKYFEQAKVIMEKLNAISVVEQAASVTVNDTMKAYEGLPNEQLMVYAFEAMNYLQMGDVDAAAVEARQFDVKQRLIAEKNKDAKYLSGAFVRYLNGMVYEEVGESDSARIELQKAVKGYQAQNAGFPVPAALSADLARIQAGRPAPSEVTFVLHNGLGPSLDENNIRVQNPNPGKNGPLMFSLAVPKYVPRPVPVARVELAVGDTRAVSEVVEDINAIGAKSFEDRLPIIIARGVARMAVKNAAAQEAKKQAGGDPLFNLMADVVTNVSERADTRTWSLIPGNILMARLPLPPGKYNVTATYYSAGGTVLARREFNEVEVRKGHKTFLSDYFMNPPAPPKAPN